MQYIVCTTNVTAAQCRSVLMTIFGGYFLQKHIQCLKRNKISLDVQYRLVIFRGPEMCKRFILSHFLQRFSSH